MCRGSWHGGHYSLPLHLDAPTPGAKRHRSLTFQDSCRGCCHCAVGCFTSSPGGRWWRRLLGQRPQRVDRTTDFWPPTTTEPMGSQPQAAGPAVATGLKDVQQDQTHLKTPDKDPKHETHQLLSPSLLFISVHTSHQGVRCNLCWRRYTPPLGCGWCLEEWRPLLLSIQTCQTRATGDGRLSFYFSLWAGQHIRTHSRNSNIEFCCRRQCKWSLVPLGKKWDNVECRTYLTRFS